MREIRKAALLTRDLETPVPECDGFKRDVGGANIRSMASASGDSGGGMMWQLGLYCERREWTQTFTKRGETIMGESVDNFQGLRQIGG